MFQRLVREIAQDFKTDLLYYMIYYRCTGTSEVPQTGIWMKGLSLSFSLPPPSPCVPSTSSLPTPQTPELSLNSHTYTYNLSPFRVHATTTPSLHTLKKPASTPCSILSSRLSSRLPRRLLHALAHARTRACTHSRIHALTQCSLRELDRLNVRDALLFQPLPHCVQIPGTDAQVILYLLDCLAVVGVNH